MKNTKDFISLTKLFEGVKELEFCGASWDQSHKEEVSNFKGKEKFSIILANEIPSPEAYENPLFFQKEEIQEISLLDQKAQKIVNSHDEIERLHKKTKLIHKEENVEYWETFDKFLEEKISEVKEEIKEELLENEVYIHMLDNSPQSFKNPDYPEDHEITSWMEKNPLEVSKIEKEISNPKTRYSYIRDYSNQIFQPLADILSDERSLIQYFFTKTEDGLLYAKGGKGSSARLNHGYFSHIFAENRNSGDTIPTYILYFDINCQPYLIKQKNLILLDQNITGNYHIDFDESKEILDSIKKVKDQDEIDFLFFLKGIIF